MSDVKRAYTALLNKQRPYTTLWNYYLGNQPIVYSTKRLEQVFGERINARFTENWCAVVIDSVLDRIAMDPPTVLNQEQYSEVLSRLWLAMALALEADSAHEEALVVGESFLVAWVDEGSDEYQIFHNDARMVHVEYDTDNPNKKKYAAKWWVDDDGYRRMTLYYADRLEYYISTRKARDMGDGVTDDSVTADGWKSMVLNEEEGNGGVAENPFGIVPVFHIRSHRRAARSELQNVIEPQDAVNKLLNDMMVAAEFGAFKQRYIISNAEVDDLKNAPNEIWNIPPASSLDGEQPTQVGEFDATNLDNYLNAIAKISSDIGVISKTPRHYFYQQGGDPSGEALIAMEAPLNKKTQKRIDNFATTWRELVQFLFQLRGVEVDPLDISINYRKPETVQPRTVAEIRELAVRAGTPLNTAYRDEGKDQAWLDQMAEDKAQDQAAQSSSMASALLNAQTEFDRA